MSIIIAGSPMRTIAKRSPRRNLPQALAVKRTESNFLLAFARSFVKATEESIVIAARELPLAGYGIADLVCILERSQCKHAVNSTLPTSSTSFVAFEVKMKDWRGALSQAYKYKYYANTSIVVLPSEDIEKARAFLQTFRSLGIGLWAFDRKLETISRIYTPAHRKPISPNANRKALHALSRSRIISPQDA
jgi:hypothetical protein